MSPKISSRRRGLASLGGLAVLAAVLATAAAAASTSSGVGTAPPEWAENAGLWPAHNYNLANTRATTDSVINAQTVSRLRVKWAFHFKGTGAFGAFSSAPVVVGRSVYLQDMNSNVYALDRSSGRVMWEHALNKPSAGPNGIAFGWGRIYGATETNAFALDAGSGRLLWSRRLTRKESEGIDMAPQVYDGTVLISTVPVASVTNYYRGGALGVVYGLDASTGKPKWTFNTVSDGSRLWGNPKVNSGGGLWYPPAVDDKGRVFLSIANPAPLYGTPEFPDGSSRPGPNLYTDSLVALDGKTGKLLWYRQAVPHDTRDYDLQIPAIITRVPLKGVETEVVLVAGKMGKVYAYRAADGQHLWTRSVGKHLHDTGPLPHKAVDIYPGNFGGVETPMALADGRLFVPWVDLHTHASATGNPQIGNFNAGRGGLTAFDAASGKLLWQQKLPSMDFGAATVANDVVFTSDFSGRVYAYSTANGKLLWTVQAPAGIDAFPAVAGNMLLVGAATPGLGTIKKPVYSLVAYALATASTTASAVNARLTATDGPGFNISMNATTVRAGRYAIVVHDRSNIHNFHLIGAGVNKKTTVAQVGTFTWKVKLERGTYRFLCDPHATIMKGALKVT